MTIGPTNGSPGPGRRLLRNRGTTGVLLHSRAAMADKPPRQGAVAALDSEDGLEPVTAGCSTSSAPEGRSSSRSSSRSRSSASGEART